MLKHQKKLEFQLESFIPWQGVKNFPEIYIESAATENVDQFKIDRNYFEDACDIEIEFGISQKDFFLNLENKDFIDNEGVSHRVKWTWMIGRIEGMLVLIQ